MQVRSVIILAISLAAPAAAQDFAESNASQWGVFASDGAPASVADSTEHVKVGASSILFTTASGFDTGVRFPASGELNFDASAFNYLVFWEYPVNDTPIGWQGNQPIVVLKSSTGSWRYEPSQQLTPNRAWRLFKVPLDGGAPEEGWTRTQTGNPSLADIDQIEIHHDTWDYGFSITFDGVRFMTLDPGGLPPQGPPPPPGVDPDRIEPKVLLHVFNPIMENFGSRRMHEVYGWRDPLELTADIVSDFEASSHGRVRFNVVETRVVDEYPIFQDGFQHTDETFASDWSQRIFHDSTFDYVRFGVENNLPARVDAGEFDEVWIYAPPIAGMWESAMAGRGAYWINGPAYPDAGGERAFVIMGWNFERGVGEAIHSWGHRAENIMVHHYGPWGADRSTTWNRFTLLDRDAPGLGGVGNVHFPVNALSDYDYANARSVASNADAWLAYPNLNEQTRTFGFHEWSPGGADPHREYLNWWYAHMPHMPGKGPDQYLANWWRYLTDVDQFKSWNGRLYVAIGIPTVEVTSPVDGAAVRGVVPIVAHAEVDGALGRVDLYIDGEYAGTDTIAPFTFEWDTAGLTGQHEIVAKAYELQNGTESVSEPVAVTVLCPADIDGDADVDVFDLLSYLDQWFAGDPGAELDGLVGVDVFDLLLYLDGWFAGCGG